jgi:hypothetical protein
VDTARHTGARETRHGQKTGRVKWAASSKARPWKVSASPRTGRSSACVLAQRTSGKCASGNATAGVTPGGRAWELSPQTGSDQQRCEERKVGGNPARWSPSPRRVRPVRRIRPRGSGGRACTAAKAAEASMSRLRTGPQPLAQVRGSRPRVGVTSAARGRSQVVARLRVLWNHTSPVDGTATPGRYVSPEIINSRTGPAPRFPNAGGPTPTTGVQRGSGSRRARARLAPSTGSSSAGTPAGRTPAEKGGATYGEGPNVAQKQPQWRQRKLR